jgi:hypothetical protein
MTYSELTLRYFEAAANAGTLAPPAGRGEGGSRAQGTWVQFDVQTDTAGPAAERIVAARFLAFGCPHTIAVASYVAGAAPGGAPSRGLPEPLQALRARFEVPVEKLGRLLIVEDAWRAAVEAALVMRS